MATLWVIEDVNGGLVSGGRATPVLSLSGTVQKATISGTAASITVGGSTNVVGLFADSDCHVNSTGTDATTSDFPMEANVMQAWSVPKGGTISVIERV